MSVSPASTVGVTSRPLEDPRRAGTRDPRLRADDVAGVVVGRDEHLLRVAAAGQRAERLGARGRDLRGDARRELGAAGPRDALVTREEHPHPGERLLAVREGLISVGTVLSSLYPVATVLLAWAVLRERFAPLQRVGMVVALPAIALLAL